MNREDETRAMNQFSGMLIAGLVALILLVCMLPFVPKHWL